MIPSIRYSLLLFLLMAVSFIIHWKLLDLMGRAIELSQLLPFYVMNYAMGVGIPFRFEATATILGNECESSFNKFFGSSQVAKLVVGSPR